MRAMRSVKSALILLSLCLFSTQIALAEATQQHDSSAAATTVKRAETGDRKLNDEEINLLTKFFYPESKNVIQSLFADTAIPAMIKNEPNPKGQKDADPIAKQIAKLWGVVNIAKGRGPFTYDELVGEKGKTDSKGALHLELARLKGEQPPKKETIDLLEYIIAAGKVNQAARDGKGDDFRLESIKGLLENKDDKDKAKRFIDAVDKELAKVNEANKEIEQLKKDIQDSGFNKEVSQNLLKNKLLHTALMSYLPRDEVLAKAVAFKDKNGNEFIDTLKNGVPTRLFLAKDALIKSQGQFNDTVFSPTALNVAKENQFWVGNDGNFKQGAPANFEAPVLNTAATGQPAPAGTAANGSVGDAAKLVSFVQSKCVGCHASSKRDETIINQLNNPATAKQGAGKLNEVIFINKTMPTTTNEGVMPNNSANRQFLGSDQARQVQQWINNVLGQ